MPESGDVSASLTEKAESAIREGIILGRYAPGDRLRERGLSEEFGVSRVPVREALRNLEFQGFVTILPRRGAVVREMSAQDVDELFDLRCALEPLAAGAAARQYAAGVPHPGLDGAMVAADAATASRDAEAILVANADFHTQLIQAARHRMLADTMPAILARTRWLFAQTADRSASVQGHEHHQLYEAIRAGEARLAEAYMLAHVEAGRSPSLQAIDPTA
jgi:Transcriptional regulators